MHGLRLHLAKRRGWLIACALLLAVLLPAQGVALSMDQTLRPAHYHLSSFRTASVPAFTDAVTPADDEVLTYLTAAAVRDARADRAAREALAAGSTATRHDSIGYHLHPLDDPDVVYVDDSGRPGKLLAGIEKPASDGMVMLFPNWPPLLAARPVHFDVATPPALECGTCVEPPERPPA